MNLRDTAFFMLKCCSNDFWRKKSFGRKTNYKGYRISLWNWQKSEVCGYIRRKKNEGER